MAIRHFGVSVVLGIFLVGRSLFASQVLCGPDRTGIVCLDQATGTPLWEFFPDEAGRRLDLKTDGETLYLIDGPFWQYAQEPTTKNRAKLKVIRVDPDTGKELERDSRRHPLPPPDRLLPAPREYLPPTIENGDRVLVSDSGRAILVTNGASPEARVIRSLDHRSGELVTVGDIVIYTRTIDALSYASAQIMVALGGDTLEPKWERDFGANVIGMWSVDGRLLVATSEVLRAIDAASGRLVWQQRLERLRGGATIEKDGNRLFVMCTVMLRDCRSPIFLYCLDERTGHVQWQYDLGDLRSRTPL
ncbi:MAG: PQQ-binding-like beta-propeller repeat protein, partial [Planctomycetes bacterium]|nr:PQQ-binding-like beta-propeller repeat protein [Planctomycetota bacterium]